MGQWSRGEARWLDIDGIRQGRWEGLQFLSEKLFTLGNGEPMMVVSRKRYSHACVLAMFFPVVMYGCESWTIKKVAAMAKSLQLCPTLCGSIDGNSPGSPVPGILQARTLEWVAISFSNA